MSLNAKLSSDTLPDSTNWFQGWTWFPQDASGDLRLTPKISKMCMWCNYACLVMAFLTHCFCTYSEVVPCARHTDTPNMDKFFFFTAFLAFGGVFFEICWATSIRFLGLAALYRSEASLRSRLRVNVKMVCVFSLLTTIYHLMAFDIQFVHAGWLARYHEGFQLVYSLRYIEWTLCAPIVLSVQGTLEHTSNGEPRNALIPSSMLSGIYCIISWQGLVVTDFYVGWGLIIFAFICYFLAAGEQLAFAWYIKDKGRAGSIRAGLMVYMVIVIGLYGLWYLLPIPGWMSTTLENKLYCFGDASFKLGTCIMNIVAHDVSATVGMRQRAETIAADLSILIDNASVPIFGINREGVLDYLNTKASQLLHPRGDDGLVGSQLCDIICEGDRERFNEAIQSALTLQESQPIEASMKFGLDPDKNQEVPVLELSASGRKNKFGEVTGVTLIGHDVTAHKHAEERKARFMATMSHELRSPLHGVIGLAQYLADKEDDPAKVANLQAICRCSKRLLGLVVDIMDLASMAVKRDNSKQAKCVVHRDPADLYKILQDTLMLIGQSVDKVGSPLLKPAVNLVSDIQRMPLIQADSAKLTQVFYNLITNACKFTAKGYIEVGAHLSPDCDWIEVSVADTGAGISQQNLQRIFQPFEQEDNSLSRSNEGLGLGLAIANEAVRLHSGEIRVRSKLGKGTTFTVRLPIDANSSVPMVENKAPALRECEAQPKASIAPCGGRDAASVKRSFRDFDIGARQQDATAQGPRQKSVILSVDDDVTEQMVLGELLKEHYTIIQVSSLEQCQEQFTRGGVVPDLVLLDLMMPVMEGVEVLTMIRQKFGLGSLDMPVLVTSAATEPHVVVKAFKAGCNNFIPKPVADEVLLAQIETTISMKFERELRRTSLPGHSGCRSGFPSEEISEGADDTAIAG